jgi:metal-dependent HD superfamily phosphatase/phosphodiesterase
LKSAKVKSKLNFIHITVSHSIFTWVTSINRSHFIQTIIIKITMKKSVNKANPLSNFENKLYTLLKGNYIEDIKKQVHHTKQKYMNIYLTFDMNYL